MVPTKEELLAAADSRFTPEIHEKLQNARVAIAGLGGLGSNAAVMLWGKQSVPKIRSDTDAW